MNEEHIIQNSNKNNQQIVDQQTALNRGLNLKDKAIGTVDIFAIECLVCGRMKFSKLEDQCICDGKECPHF